MLDTKEHHVISWSLYKFIEAIVIRFSSYSFWKLTEFQTIFAANACAGMCIAKYIDRYKGACFKYIDWLN